MGKGERCKSPSFYLFSNTLQDMNSPAGCFESGLFGAGLPISQQAYVCNCLQHESFENNVGKGEIARNEQFLLFPHCFLPFWRTFRHFYNIKNCRLQTLSVWKSLNFVVSERVKQDICVVCPL